MNPQHHLVDRKDPERNTQHVPEELDRKSPRERSAILGIKTKTKTNRLQYFRHSARGWRAVQLWLASNSGAGRGPYVVEHCDRGHQRQAVSYRALKALSNVLKFLLFRHYK